MPASSSSQHKLACIASLIISLTAQALSGASGTSSDDWMVHPARYKARASSSPAEVELSNGLIRRVIRIHPNAATIAFENLMTGDSILRSVGPEGRITLDGISYNIGGLTGQPIQNYLDKTWIPQLQDDPDSFHLASFETGKTVARFPWKKHPEWMPQDLPWPPPGVSLTLQFRPPAGFQQAGRPLQPVLADDLAKWSDAWKLQVSKRNSRNSMQNEGKTGEIMAGENNHAFAERSWPADAVAAQLLVDPGTDKSASWGPGLGLVFENQVIKLHIRPGKNSFGILASGQERETGKAEPGKAYYLRIVLAGNKAIFETSLDAKNWNKLGDAPVKGSPKAVRIGKMGKDGGAADFSEDGQLERCRIGEFRLLAKPAPAPGASPDRNLNVAVHYELYDGIPLLSKWMVISNGTDKPVRLNAFVSEILAVVEGESYVDNNPRWELPNLHVETDYAFGGMGTRGGNKAVKWVTDPAYKTQVNYELKTPCLLECAPPLGPDQVLQPGASLETMRTFELAHDSTDRERKGLAQRRMYRTIAPWVTENPVLMHVRSARPDAVKLAVDQCAETGFEMVIMTFGSGFNFESRDKAYQLKIKELADYARAKGIVIGGYSLLASRGAAQASDNCVGECTFGVMPCLGANWGADYLRQLKDFISTAGLQILEHDGSYPGDTCAATNHPFHKGQNDSQWVQWKAITDLYKWCRSEGVYLNIPDWYFLTGGNKTGMGYRENNWSLPRDYQEIIERQNIYDGTWEKTPGMGWMFVPLTEYHGGGPSATIEPLKDHLPHYETRLANLFGAGVMACYRGPRLYDADETKEVVKRWTGFYKQYRAILNSDLIHLRRADGRDWDGWMHVNPELKECGLAVIYNPLPEKMEREIRLPLYYTGLTDTAHVQVGDASPRKVSLARDYTAPVKITIPAKERLVIIIRK